VSTTLSSRQTLDHLRPLSATTDVPLTVLQAVRHRQQALSTSLQHTHARCLIGVTERQSARMSKITNDRLTRSGTGCFVAVPI